MKFLHTLRHWLFVVRRYRVANKIPVPPIIEQYMRVLEPRGFFRAQNDIQNKRLEIAGAIKMMMNSPRRIDDQVLSLLYVYLDEILLLEDAMFPSIDNRCRLRAHASGDPVSEVTSSHLGRLPLFSNNEQQPVDLISLKLHAAAR